MSASPPNHPDFIEIGTPDPVLTAAFFVAVMDWDWAEMRSGGGGYFTDGTRKVGMHTEGVACRVPYLPLQDIEAVMDAGGTLMGDILMRRSWGGLPPAATLAECGSGFFNNKRGCTTRAPYAEQQTCKVQL